MARKNLLANVMAADTDKAPKESRADYAMRGASRSMKMSIDDMVESAKRLVDGETIISLDPDLIDASFVNDRLSADDDEFEDLKKSIGQQGQSTPILVRPHPDVEGRFMIVFGHRRMRVAQALGIQVRAVVKSMEDISHVIAQGQENTARADLSFIEKALFAKKLLDMGQTKETIMSALTVDSTLLSRMLAVSQKVPIRFIEEIGAAKGIGRDRWEDFKKLIVVPANLKRADIIIQEIEFIDAPSNERFEFLLSLLQSKGIKPRRTKPLSAKAKNWEDANGRLKASIKSSNKAFSISLTSADAGEFGNFLSENLEELYRSFQAKKAEEN
ncbi:MAG: plasmid partitioning protein RepB [Planctomycetaceae bacterium]|nr:plasmid partitioning protein RepB [Planctomycetaceae bacterium]